MSTAGYIKASARSSLGQVTFGAIELAGNVKLCEKETNPVSQHVLRVGRARGGHGPFNANETFQSADA